MGIRSIFLLICLALTSNCFSQLTANAGDNKYMCPRQPVVRRVSPAGTGCLAYDKYNWQPSTSLKSTSIQSLSATPTSSITFTITVTDDIGAVSTDVAFVYVNDTM